MQGIKIKCPNCREICFETTDKFRPDVTVNGSMVRTLPRITWHIDWLCSDVTPAAQMTCPMCDVGQLAPSGRLLLVDPPPFKEPEIPQVETPAPVEEVKPEAKTEAPNPLICDVCGKECKNQLGLNSHKRSHKK